MNLLDQYLLVRRPGANPERIDLHADTPCGLGRAPENRIVLTDSSVSRQHARLFSREDGWWVEDLGSKNGTKVNGNLIEGPKRLKQGDGLQVGSFQLVFSSESASASARLADVAAPANMTSVPLESLSAGTDTRAFARNMSPERVGSFLKAMDRIGQALIVHRPLNELYQFIVTLASEVLRADRTALLLLEEGGELAAKAVMLSGNATAGDIVVSRTIAKNTIEQRQAVLIGNAMADTRFKGQQSVIQQRIHSAMCVPLWHDTDVLGLLYVDNTAAVVPFEESDLRILTFLAHLAAMKIRETESHEELQRQQRLEAELKRAATLQQSLLPTGARKVGRMDIAGKNVPSFDVGGDYFDFVPGPDGRMIVSLGDVAGKGMAAALLMTDLRATMRAQVEVGRPITDLTSRLNRSIYETVQGERFITLMVTMVNGESGEVAYVNGGHNPPYLLRADGTLETLSVGGLLLGVFPEAVYETATITLRAGDVLTLYSDGVTEARSPEGEEYGEERLEAFLRGHRDLPPEKLVNELIAEVVKFTNAAQLVDDVTVVVIRCDS
ncbi:MAG: SpoIIE family protein phosphatase [Candidatus Eisenbacteria bacterium]